MCLNQHAGSFLSGKESIRREFSGICSQSHSGMCYIDRKGHPLGASQICRSPPLAGFSLQHSRSLFGEMLRVVFVLQQTGRSFADVMSSSASGGTIRCAYDVILHRCEQRYAVASAVLACPELYSNELDARVKEVLLRGGMSIGGHIK